MSKSGSKALSEGVNSVVSLEMKDKGLLCWYAQDHVTNKQIAWFKARAGNS